MLAGGGNKELIPTNSYLTDGTHNGVSVSYQSNDTATLNGRLTGDFTLNLFNSAFDSSKFKVGDDVVVRINKLSGSISGAGIATASFEMKKSLPYENLTNRVYSDILFEDFIKTEEAVYLRVKVTDEILSEAKALMINFWLNSNTTYTFNNFKFNVEVFKVGNS